ncbi:MAG: 50S ribosomal protein L29 [Clostridia bacterium]|nr:50S ribosomal protein L29 [Clostridia bacterium]
MKINKIKEMSSPELEKELSELKTELFKLRFNLATNSLDNPMKIKEVKKDIARINTVLTERKLEENK